MKFESLRGFRDIYPEDAEPRDSMLSTVKKVARSFGYQIIDFPSVEPLDLYRIKSGDELVSQTFSFTDKGGREVTLIPEATPSVVRMLTAKKDLPRPVRWFSLPKIWRYEEPQSGRLREHVQFNADIFGIDTPEADSEIVGLACTILDSLGLAGNYEIRINHRKMMDEILKTLGVEDIPRVFGIIDRFRKIDRQDFLGLLHEAGVNDTSASIIEKLAASRVKAEDSVAFIGEFMEISGELKESLDRVISTIRMISHYTSSAVVMDFSTVRGLSYYTGLVFEAFDIRGELRAILGGGRYNGLSSLISGQDIPAIGFGMGDVVLELLLKRSGLWRKNEAGTRYYICTASDDAEEASLKLSIDLRRKGFEVIRDMGKRSLSAQLKSASANGCNFAIILGSKEVSSGSVTLRNMLDGKQETKRIENFLNSI
ncbi:MAG: histidine--tRNA ligase [Candidatus Thermoplasmatota archaeon]|nr:histidine--tRNA ligase [Candidatus Thermoplasmatota archaeon]